MYQYVCMHKTDLQRLHLRHVTEVNKSGNKGHNLRNDKQVQRFNQIQ